MKYKLEKLIDGEWYCEGVFSEGEYIAHLANAAFWLGRNSSSVEDIRVIIM